MDATTLRIVLLIAGLCFLGGIYLYETRRRRRESAQARRRVPPRVEQRLPPIEALDRDDEPDEDDLEPAEFETRREPHLSSDFDDAFEEDYDREYGEAAEEITERLEPEDEEEPAAGFDSLRINDEPIPGIDDPVPGFEQPLPVHGQEPSSSEAMEQQDLFGFSAQEESPVDVPDLIIQINVRARKEPFDGPAIEKAMQETGLRLSELAIYQRLASDGSRKVLYNLASMVEPGVFPIKGMVGFSTPGLTLFAQLPGPGDSLMIFSDMLYTAERLAAMLAGDLQDETHSALTKQTIEHLRERILEQKRQIQLARRKG